MSVDSSGPTLAELAADLQDSQDTLRLVIDEFADATRQLRRAELLGADDLVERERSHVEHWRALLVEAVRPLLLTLDALDVEVTLRGTAQRRQAAGRTSGWEG